MQNALRILFTCALMGGILWPATTYSLTPEIGAELRARTELNLHRGSVRTQSFPAQDTNDTLHILSLLRTRVNLKLVKDSATHMFLQLQDSRFYGHASGTSGGLEPDMNLGVHQAYVDLRHWLWYGLHTRVGRQELTYGNHRLMGNVGWSNVGRSYDGAKVGIHFANEMAVEAVLATMLERDSINRQQGKGQDIMLGVLAWKAPKQGFEVMLVGEVDGARPDTINTGRRQLLRSTFAAYSARTFATQFDYIANLAVQSGKWINLADTSEVDIQAYMLALELGWKLPGRARARLALGLDHTSGDNGADSTKFKEFNNLYYTGHKFRGHMDNFIGPALYQATNGPGLTDVYALGHFNFLRSWQMGIDLHYFQTAENYVSLVDGSAQKTLGPELDFWVAAKEYRGVGWQYGLSLFFWDEHYVGPNAEKTQFFSYGQITFNID